MAAQRPQQDCTTTHQNRLGAAKPQCRCYAAAHGRPRKLAADGEPAARATPRLAQAVPPDAAAAAPALADGPPRAASVRVVTSAAGLQRRATQAPPCCAAPSNTEWPRRCSDPPSPCRCPSACSRAQVRRTRSRSTVVRRAGRQVRTQWQSGLAHLPRCAARAAAAPRALAQHSLCSVAAKGRLAHACRGCA